MAWQPSDYITKDEWDLIKLLRPSDGTVRTINTDHNGDVHMLIRWPKAYVDEQKAKIDSLKLSPEDEKLREDWLEEKYKPIPGDIVDIKVEDIHIFVEESSQVTENEVHYCEQHRRYEYN